MVLPLGCSAGRTTAPTCGPAPSPPPRRRLEVRPPPPLAARAVLSSAAGAPRARGRPLLPPLRRRGRRFGAPCSSPFAGCCSCMGGGACVESSAGTTAQRPRALTSPRPDCHPPSAVLFSPHRCYAATLRRRPPPPATTSPHSRRSATTSCCARSRAVTSLTHSLRRHPLTVLNRRYIPAPLLAPKTLLVPPPLPSSICLFIFNLQGSDGPGGRAAARGEGETHATSALPARCSTKCLTDIRNSRMFKYQ
jgi:hypothetical protein